MRQKTIGMLAILGASIMWALESIFAKLAFSASGFIQTFIIRAIIISLIALSYVLITKGSIKVGKKQISVLVYLALAGTVFGDTLYLYALTKTAVVNAVLVAHLQPVFIAIIGYFILKEERLSAFDYIGITLMILAGLLVTTKTISNLLDFNFGSFGDIMVLLSTVAWATTAIATRKYLRELNAGTLSFYRYSISSLILLVYFMFSFSQISLNIYQILLGVVVGIGVILYYEGLRNIKAAQVSALELSSPFFAALLGFFVLGEGITIMQFGGMILLFAGVYFISKDE